jgi:hypothetical protein
MCAEVQHTRETHSRAFRGMRATYQAAPIHPAFRASTCVSLGRRDPGLGKNIAPAERIRLFEGGAAPGRRSRRFVPYDTQKRTLDRFPRSCFCRSSARGRRRRSRHNPKIALSPWPRYIHSAPGLTRVLVRRPPAPPLPPAADNPRLEPDLGVLGVPGALPSLPTTTILT